MNAESLAVVFSCLLAGAVSAQQSLESEFRTTGPAVTAAFEPQRAVLQSSSAVILDGRKEIGYGVVVSSEGHILTKASEIEDAGKLAVIVDRTNYSAVSVVGTDPAWDVALLKVDATGLLPVEYAPSSDVPQGSWVVANGATSRFARRALAGVISAKPREIPAAGGAALGVVLEPKKNSVTVEDVVEGSGAQEAGLEKGDVILSVAGTRIKRVEDLAETLKDRKTGSTVEVVCRRGKKEFTAEVRLFAKGEIFDETRTRNDEMSGDYSKRRSGFPRVIQHDILGSSRVTGGPLLDLDGRCIGMNIARANRAESFAIPVEELREIAARLMNGEGEAADGNRENGDE